MDLSNDQVMRTINGALEMEFGTALSMLFETRGEISLALGSRSKFVDMEEVNSLGIYSSNSSLSVRNESLNSFSSSF